MGDCNHRLAYRENRVVDQDINARLEAPAALCSPELYVDVKSQLCAAVYMPRQLTRSVRRGIVHLVRAYCTRWQRYQFEHNVIVAFGASPEGDKVMQGLVTPPRVFVENTAQKCWTYSFEAVARQTLYRHVDDLSLIHI